MSEKPQYANAARTRRDLTLMERTLKDVIVAIAEPKLPKKGQGWFDPSTNLLKVFDGRDWTTNYIDEWISGALHVPDKTSANSWHVDSDGNMYIGCSEAAWIASHTNAAAYILSTGAAVLTSAVIAGYVVESKGTYAGDGSDGDISGALTITGSNNTYIVKQYDYFAPGANTFTVTPTNCIVHIKVRNDCDLSNTVVDWNGKGAVAPAVGSSGNDGNQSLGKVTGGVFGTGPGGTNQSAGGGGSGASSFNDGVLGNAGQGSAVNQPGGPGGTATFDGNDYDFMMAGKSYIIGCGASGACGGGSVNVPGGVGGPGGGALIFEIGGDLTLNSTTIELKGDDGTDGSIILVGQGNSGGGGAGAGGMFMCTYNGTKTGSVVPDVSGGIGGDGTVNNDNVGGGIGGKGADGPDGDYLIALNTEFA